MASLEAVIGWWYSQVTIKNVIVPLTEVELLNISVLSIINFVLFDFIESSFTKDLIILMQIWVEIVNNFSQITQNLFNTSPIFNFDMTILSYAWMIYLVYHLNMRAHRVVSKVNCKMMIIINFNLPSLIITNDFNAIDRVLLII